MEALFSTPGIPSNQATTAYSTTATATDVGGAASCCICDRKCVVTAGPRDYCLLHYFATGGHRLRRQPSVAPGATRPGAQKKSPHHLERAAPHVRNAPELERQLGNEVQDLFAEAFLDLRKEIAEESARAFARVAAPGSDPLATLLDDRRRPPPRGGGNVRRDGTEGRTGRGRAGEAAARARKNGPALHGHSRVGEVKRKRTEVPETEGGFIREVKLPEKLRKLDERPVLDLNLDGRKPVARRTVGRNDHRNRYGKAVGSTTPAQYGRGKAPVSDRLTNNPYRKRSGSRASIWNMALDSSIASKDPTSHAVIDADWKKVEREMLPSMTCSCGSARVEISGKVTTRNNDVRKGEIWGMKDRPENVSRCRCLACGKSWNNEE